MKFELKFSGNFEVDRIFWFSSQYQVGLSVAVIMALSHRGMLRTRTSILSGVTAPQACNRNLATVVRGLSRSLSNSLIWSQICSMGFRSGLWAGHCMTLTPHPSSRPHPSRRKLCVFRAVCGIVMCKHKISLESSPIPGDFGATCQCSIAGSLCHPPTPAPICLMHGKHPIPWGRGWHFHPFLGCNSKLVFHQIANELVHTHHSGKGYTWTSTNIMKPVLIVPVPVPAFPYAASAAMIMSQSGASGWTSWVIPSCYQTSLDCVGRNTMPSSPDELHPDSG